MSKTKDWLAIATLLDEIADECSMENPGKTSRMLAFTSAIRQAEALARQFYLMERGLL